MKKYFLSIVALAGMLFATSCQESLVEPQMDGTTTFTVQLPDGMGTKAYGDESSTQATINRLYVEVYSKDGNTLVYEPSVITMNNATATVTLNLVSTQEYDIIFWAQNEFCTYDVTDLRSVKMNANHHNSETGAAFYAVLNDYTPINGQQGVTLTRPFAQLNLATTTEVSYANGTNNNKVTIESAKITVKGVAPSFDRINGQTNGEGYAPALSNEVTYTYENTDATTNFPKAAGEIEVAGKKYQYVSMDYFAVPGNQSTVQVTAEIKVKDPNGVESTITRVIESVPVQLNHKTNIVGNLITSATEFEVIVEEGWAGTNDKEVEFRDVATQEELQDAIEEGVDNITLTKNITVNSTLVFKAVPSQSNISRASADVAEFVLDLNGNNLSYAVQDNVGASAIINIHPNAKLSIVGNGTISFVSANPDLNDIPSYATNTITNTGSLTIAKGVVVENGSEGGASYAVDNHGKFVLNGGTLLGNRCALRVAKYNQDNVSFVMNSGLVKAATPAWVQLPGSNSSVAPNIEVIINDGTFESTNSTSPDNDVLYTYSFGNSHANTKLTINGGNFKGGTVSIGAGYKGDAPELTINGGIFDYDVLQWLDGDESKVLYRVVTSSSELKTAIDNNVATIVLTEGTYTLPSLSGKEGVVIIGTEGTVIGGGNTSTGFGANFGKNTTIKNVTFSGTSNGVRWSYAQGGESIFENCTFAGESTYGFHIDESKGATFTFNNCVFSGFNAFAGDLMKTTFNHCTFEHNGSYGHTNIWSVACFNDCTWEAGASVGPGDDNAKLYFNGVEESWQHEF